MNDVAFADLYRDKRVFLTGHTGFKGSWMAEWLLALGAEVTGYSLSPPTTPALYDQLGLRTRLNHIDGDVRDLSKLGHALKAARPDFVFHLAAQPLVRLSYREPIETFSTNIMGTVNVLESVRVSGRPCTVIAVTTDKCYENNGLAHDYDESEPMGGHDPYSSSKGAAELVISAYRRSYFSEINSAVRVASARAGNVLGGGDWALDRIVPDSISALKRGEVIPVRNKASTRPWQHVLEPLSGYLTLGAQLAEASLRGAGNALLASAFNFGPPPASNRTVGELVQEILKNWPGRWSDKSDIPSVHEAKLLNLATGKARELLRWEPVWSFEKTVTQTVKWYRENNSNPKHISAFTIGQIADYTADARATGLYWTK
jgi:CDP-glucose 4,6-dehydratase